MKDGEIYTGLIRMHILHHAAKEPICGAWMLEELRHHGYAISPGTLYPMLKGLERKGYLKSRAEGPGKRDRRFYRATAKGKTALSAAKKKVAELFGELTGRD